MTIALKANADIASLVAEVRRLRAVLESVAKNAELFGSWGDNTYTLDEDVYNSVVKVISALNGLSDSERARHP
jgi:hypothetical protein